MGQEMGQGTEQRAAIRAQFDREEGAGGLARVLRAATEFAGVSSSETRDTVVFMDFDRTLTNGLATGAQLPLAERVRGGEETVAALREAAEAGVPLWIVTARSPRKMVVAQLAASLRGPQREIGEFFLSAEQFADGSGDAGPAAEEEMFGGCQLAFATDARLYASDYQKPAALAHALSRRYPANSDADADTDADIVVVFVDDVAVNAHDVGTRVHTMLEEAGRGDLARRLSMRAVWWDTILEDTGASPSMLPEFGKTEQSYQDYMHPQLLDFGIDAAEASRRKALYEAEDAASGRPKKVVEVRKPGKLKAASSDQANLAAFLFGGGKQGAPPGAPASSSPAAPES